jgi:hypothetical protein
MAKRKARGLVIDDPAPDHVIERALHKELHENYLEDTLIRLLRRVGELERKVCDIAVEMRDAKSDR